MTESIHAEHVLFDWDGTLLNSFPAGYEASLKVFRHFGISIDRARYLETYSPNWYDSYRQLGVPESEWETANRIWLETYHATPSELFPFACTTLNRLRERGHTLGLVTSGNRERIERELERFGFNDMFATVVCFEDTERKKPNPEPLQCALSRLQVDAASAVYVGDRPEDVEMGQKVGAYTVAVESEYGPRQILEQADPDLLLEHAGLLPDRLKSPADSK